MALTRKMLKAMGIEEDKIDEIIDAHTDVVDDLKKERDRYKADAEKLPDVQKELDDLKAAGDDGFKAKYENEHRDFEQYKNQVEAEKATAEKSSLYRQFLLDTGVAEKHVDAVLRVTDMNKITVKDGKLDNKDELTKSVKSEWGSFITSIRTDGAEVDSPPDAEDGEQDLGSMSMEDYIAARKKM